jgi:DNA-binding XRE family transcriptional regulator
MEDGMNVQIITTPGGEEMAVLPLAEFQKLLARAEMAETDEEAAAILERVKAGQEEVFPAEVVHAILDGANPVKVLREHRRMTQKDLAATAGINAVYLSQIERGERAGSLATLSALAKALNVDPAMLFPGA